MLGQWALLERLHEMHGQYKILGHTQTGKDCIVSVNSLESGFRFDYNEDSNSAPLYTLALHPHMRLMDVELRDNPDKRTNIKLRDRLRVAGKPAEDIDVKLSIEESTDGKSAVVDLEDKIKRKHYFCRGAKLVTKKPVPARRGPAIRPPVRSSSWYEEFN